MTCDQWKCDPGWDDEPEEECFHDDYEVDILTGRAECCRCPYSWYQTEAQILAEIERQRAYDEWQREQERPWYRFKQWVSGIRGDLQWRWRRLWKPRPLTLDDEIPF